MCFFRNKTKSYNEEKGKALFSEYNELLYYIKVGDIVNIEGRDIMFWKHDPPKFEYDSYIQVHLWHQAVFYFTDQNGNIYDYSCSWVLKKVQARLFYERKQKMNEKKNQC